MRALLISHAAGSYGAERVLLALAKGLSSRGHDIVLSFPHDGPAVEAAAALGTTVHVEVSRRRRLPRRLREAPGYFARARADAHAVLDLVRRLSPDVTWVNSLYNPWAAVGARLAARPVVWHLHERSLPWPVGPAVGGLVSATASRVVVVSEYAADSFRRSRRLRSLIDVVPNPCLPRTGAPVPSAERTRDGAFTVGYVGQLEPRKRAPDLARAVALVPDVRAVFVGDGKARSRLERAIVEAGVERRVELMGFRHDVSRQLARCDCVAIPSLREPFGLVALEAMAHGVPVIAARSGALPEVLADAALYHRPADPRDLAEQIRRLRDDENLRCTLTARGLARVAAFDQDRWIATVERLLEEVVGGARVS